MLATMTERKGACAQPQRTNDAVMSDPTERHDHAEAGRGGERRRKKLAAGGELRTGRLVGGRHTSDRVGDRRIDQPQPVVRPLIVDTG